MFGGHIQTVVMKIQESSKKTSIIALYYSYSEVLAATKERDAHPLDVS